MEIERLLAEHSQAILNQSVEAVRRGHLPHYEHLDEEVIRERLAILLRLTQEAVRTRNVGPMLEHIRGVASERFASGCGLAEVQTALNVLEEAIWERAVVLIHPDDLALALALCTTTLGAAKDCLARTYVSLASRTHVPSLNPEALFHGLSEAQT